MGHRFGGSAALAITLWVGLSVAAGRPRTRPETPRPPVADGPVAERGLCYGPHGDANRLDLYRPRKAAPSPLVIWIHGGGWAAGDKDDGYPAPLLDAGYAVASINYRLSLQAPFPAQIEDCKAAVRFLRANAARYRLDPNHFGVWGVSSGGHLAALLGTSGGVPELEGDGPNRGVSSRVQAVVDWYGPTDLLRWRAQLQGITTVDPDRQDSVVGLLFGGSVQKHRERAETANPIRYITADAAPFLIMHGDRDNTVPLAQSLLLDKALKAAGGESTLLVLHGSGHAGPGFAEPEINRIVLAFLDRRLKPRTGAPGSGND